MANPVVFALFIHDDKDGFHPVGACKVFDDMQLPQKGDVHAIIPGLELPVHLAARRNGIDAAVFLLPDAATMAHVLEAQQGWLVQVDMAEPGKKPSIDVFGPAQVPVHHAVDLII